MNELIEDRLTKVNNRGLPVLPIQQLMVTLRFYATGSFHRENGDLVGLHESTIYRIIHHVTILICSLKHRYLFFPDADQRERNKVLFYEIANFPGKV